MRNGSGFTASSLGFGGLGFVIGSNVFLSGEGGSEVTMESVLKVIHTKVPRT